MPAIMRRFLPAILSALVLSLSAPRAMAGVFDPETFTLDNGMQVVVVSNHRVPVVNHMVWYRVGSADEPPGKSGLAHFLEHLMFKGTTNYPAGEFSAMVARLGGQENAFTSYDFTAYFQTIAVEHLETVMGFEADRMTNLVLTPEVIEPERQVILEERRQRTDNRPAAILREHVGATLYMNHPYRTPIIGWAHEIAELSQEDIMAFYRRWYAPENAILVVAGDITADALRPLTERTYGRIPRGSDGPRTRPAEPPQLAARTVVFTDERVRQPSWQRIHLAPSYQTGESQLAPALELLAEILGGGATSRLYRALVIDQGIAVSAGAGYSPDAMGPAEFSLYASPRPGVSLETLEAAIMVELERLRAEGVTAAELERAKTGMLAEAVYARDSLSSGARVLGAALARGLSADHVEEWPNRIRSVTLDDLARAAGEVIRETGSVTAKLLPAGKEGP